MHISDSSAHSVTTGTSSAEYTFSSSDSSTHTSPINRPVEHTGAVDMLDFDLVTSPSPPEPMVSVSPQWLGSVLDSTAGLAERCSGLQVMLGYYRQLGRLPDGGGGRRRSGPRLTVLERYLRKITQELLEIDVNGPVGWWLLPERSLVDAYNEHNHSAKGPHMLNLSIDWFYSDCTPWMDECIKIIAEVFLCRYCVGDYPRLRKRLTILEVSGVIRSYILHLKARYSKAAAGFVGVLDYYPSPPQKQQSESPPTSGSPLCH